MDYAASIRQALDYMENQLREEIRIEDVAAATNFSPSHFHDIFARVTGCTPAEHLRKRRLSCAALDLALSQRRLLDIAVDYRFDSQAAFTRAFKRQFGITPGLFRRHRAPLGARPIVGLHGPLDPIRKGSAPTAAHPHQPSGDGDTDLLLEDVMRVGFYDGDSRCPESYPFPSCLTSALRYMGEAFPWVPHHAHGREWQLNMGYIRLMALSGISFGLLWREGWHMDNPDMMFIADPRDVIARAFAAAGYTYALVEKTGAPDDEARYRQKLRTSLEQGRPVLAFGVIGPPECCLVTGYAEGGAVLLGWNYFQPEQAGYFQKRDWFAGTHSLILIGEKTAPVAGPEADRDALRWALSVARTPMVLGRHSGFAAYTAWAKQILDDSAFADADEHLLRQRHDVHMMAGLTVAECRWSAALYLQELAERRPELAEELLAAADLYLAEHDLMWKVWDEAGGNGAPDAWAKFARPEVRRRIHPLILQSRQLDETAAGHLERVLAR